MLKQILLGSSVHNIGPESVNLFNKADKLLTILFFESLIEFKFEVFILIVDIIVAH
jgi:hypothetical protein